MKRFLVKLLVFLILLAGAAWLLYPFASNSVSKGKDAALMERYHQAVREMTPEQIEQMLQFAAAYNEQLTGEGIKDPFSGENRRFERSYQSLMNVRDGVIGELVIPGINVSLPIYHSGEGMGANERLVHVDKTALPAGQNGTHTVLAGPGIQTAGGFLGELALTDARMLEDLDRVIPNDLLFLNILDRTMIYRVEGVRTLSPEGLEAENFAGEEEAQLLTLITERKGRRLLIQARRLGAKDVREELIAEDRAESPTDVVNILLLGIPVMLLGLLVMMIVEQFKKKSYRLPTEQKRRKRNQPEPDLEEEDTSGEEEPEGKNKPGKKETEDKKDREAKEPER